MRSGHTARRGLTAALLALVVLLVAATSLGTTSAAFTATTSNPDNTIATDRLAPPGTPTVNLNCESATAAIAFRAMNTAAGANTLTLPIPVGTKSGDVLVAQVATNTTATLTKPADWNLIRRDVNGSALASAVYWKAAGATESDPTFTLPAGAGVQMTGGIAAYSGVDMINPVDASERATGYSGSIRQAEVRTNSAGTMLVYFTTTAGVATTAPSETTQHWQHGSGASAWVTAADEPFDSAGTMTPKTMFSALSGSPAYVAQILVLRRGTATPSASVSVSVSVSWTPTPSGWADGYRLERLEGTTPTLTQALPIRTTSFTDTSVTSGTAYSYQVSATRGTWRSDPVTRDVTPSC